MSNEQNADYNESKIDSMDLPDNFKNKTLKDLNKEEVKEMFSKINKNSKTSGLFFNFLDSIFDLGFKLLENVNFDIILDKIEELMKKDK